MKYINNISKDRYTMCFEISEPFFWGVKKRTTLIIISNAMNVLFIKPNKKF